jgi:hypothetical protein
VEIIILVLFMLVSGYRDAAFMTARWHWSHFQCPSLFDSGQFIFFGFVHGFVFEGDGHGVTKSK